MTRTEIFRFTQMKCKLIAMPKIKLVLLLHAYLESQLVKWLSTHNHFINFQRRSVVTEKGRAKLTGFKGFSGCIVTLDWLGCLIRKEPLKRDDAARNERWKQSSLFGRSNRKNRKQIYSQCNTQKCFFFQKWQMSTTTSPIRNSFPFAFVQ